MNCRGGSLLREHRGRRRRARHPRGHEVRLPVSEGARCASAHLSGATEFARP